MAGDRNDAGAKEDAGPVVLRGELRCYVGGMPELVAVGEMFLARWKPGVMVCRARYHNKVERRRLIDKMVDTWKDVEIVIRPDDMAAAEANWKQKEEELNNRI